MYYTIIPYDKGLHLFLFPHMKEEMSNYRMIYFFNKLWEGKRDFNMFSQCLYGSKNFCSITNCVMYSTWYMVSRMIAQSIYRNWNKNLSKDVIYMHVSFEIENVSEFENVLIEKESIEPLKILYEHFGLDTLELTDYLGSFTEKLVKFREKYVPKKPVYILTELQIAN